MKSFLSVLLAGTVLASAGHITAQAIEPSVITTISKPSEIISKPVTEVKVAANATPVERTYSTTVTANVKPVAAKPMGGALVSDSPVTPKQIRFAQHVNQQNRTKFAVTLLTTTGLYLVLHDVDKQGEAVYIDAETSKKIDMNTYDYDIVEIKHVHAVKGISYHEAKNLELEAEQNRNLLFYGYTLLATVLLSVFTLTLAIRYA